MRIVSFFDVPDDLFLSSVCRFFPPAKNSYNGYIKSSKFWFLLSSSPPFPSAAVTCPFSCQTSTLGSVSGRESQMSSRWRCCSILQE